MAADRLTVAVALLHDHADVRLHELGDVHDLQGATESSHEPQKAFHRRQQVEFIGTDHLGLEHQLPALHGNLVGVGQRRAEGQDELVGEDLQGPRLAAFVHGDGLPAHAEPQLRREGSVTALEPQRSDGVTQCAPSADNDFIFIIITL